MDIAAPDLKIFICEGRTFACPRRLLYRSRPFEDNLEAADTNADGLKVITYTSANAIDCTLHFFRDDDWDFEPETPLSLCLKTDVEVYFHAVDLTLDEMQEKALEKINGILDAREWTVEDLLPALEVIEKWPNEYDEENAAGDLWGVLVKAVVKEGTNVLRDLGSVRSACNGKLTEFMVSLDKRLGEVVQETKEWPGKNVVEEKREDGEKKGQAAGDEEQGQ